MDPGDKSHSVQSPGPLDGLVSLGGRASMKTVHSIWKLRKHPQHYLETKDQPIEDEERFSLCPSGCEL